MKKLLGFDHMHENKNIFFICFLKNNFDFLKKFRKKPAIFNTRYVSYSVSLQSDIMKNC